MSTGAHHYLPAVLAEIADAAGLPAALAIADHCGGTKTHLPGRAPEGHWLVELVGREAADKICNHFRSRDGGVTLRIPLGPKGFYNQARRRAEEMIEQGKSSRAIASALGIHQRSVERYRARAKDIGKDSRQGRLF